MIPWNAPFSEKANSKVKLSVFLNFLLMGTPCCLVPPLAVFSNEKFSNSVRFFLHNIWALMSPTLLSQQSEKSGWDFKNLRNILVGQSGEMETGLIKGKYYVVKATWKILCFLFLILSESKQKYHFWITLFKASLYVPAI